MATLVRVADLDPGNDFLTAATNRPGIVVDKPCDRSEGVACVVGEDEVNLHPDVKVIPIGRAWLKKPCKSMERFRVHVDESHDMACCKAEIVPYGFGVKVHSGLCCSSPECVECDERLIEARMEAF